MRGAAVRAGHRAFAGREFFQQVLHFLGRKRIVRFDRGAASRAGDGFVGGVFFVIMGLGFQRLDKDVQEAFGLAKLWKDRRPFLDRERVPAERFHDKPQFLQGRQSLPNDLGAVGRQFPDVRRQQRLGFSARQPGLIKQFFVHHAFRRRMLVDDQQFIALFGQNIDLLELAEDTNGRVGEPGNRRIGDQDGRLGGRAIGFMRKR